GPRGSPLALAPGPKGVGKLRDRENALAGGSLDLLLLHPAQQADVVLLERLTLAPLAELADGAVIVENQPRQCVTALELPEFLHQAFGLARVRAEAHPRRLALLAMPENAVLGRFSLEARQE